MVDRVLITGAGGYIGSILVDELLAHDYQVVAYDRFYFGQDVLNRHRADDRLALVKKDIRDAEPADFEGISVVCDLAAMSNDPSGEIDPDLTVAVNYEGRARVCRLAKEAGVSRYVLSSSCSVYGANEDSAIDETSPAAPLTTYARANLDAERGTLPLADDGFAVTVLRNATVFGLSPRMRFDLVINLMTLHAAEKGVITIMGGGQQWRPLIHVRDVARMFRTVIEADRSTVNGEIFNVGLANLQVRSLAFIIRETLPMHVTVSVAPDDRDKRSYDVSFEKAKRLLGFEANTAIEEGVREIYQAIKYGRVEESAKTSTVNWYRNILDAKALLEEIELNGRVL
jgi:nucleoside-diphosphate-sugar epimerase